ncbi:unnamed protein product [Heligmosomoides polygyrus]|uniref:HARE-HTH domain-containing protein n=1 Tax=Heligmosomoides polygyrus TaxID=6339 RepID=A0A183GPR9_HELPZ|nr:unnamed protein product [Heligmosomoides polygyrus]
MPVDNRGAMDSESFRSRITAQEKENDKRTDDAPEAQTDVANVRVLLGEVQRRLVEVGDRKPSYKDEERMGNDNNDNAKVEKVDLADWSSLRATLEAAFEIMGRTNPKGSSGAVLKSMSEKGRLNYVCKDGYLKTTASSASSSPEL